MATTHQEQSLQSVATWEETPVALKDFSDKCPTPNIVKVTKGQYRNIGVAKSVNSELLLHSIVTSKKILAEGIRLKDGKKAISSDQKFSLPFSYQGWFELLSEDGKSIRAITSVQDLAKVFPQSCLVRENIKGFISNENGEFCMDRTRTVYAGEQLNLVGDVVIPVPSYKLLGFSTKRRLLRCFDTKGESVYLGFDQRGLFSPIAGQSNISGVHNIKGLLEKFRLPIMVRLVHGIIPTRLDRGNFTGVFRLVSAYSDETAFVCPLHTDAKMVPISTREPLKLVTAQNKQEIETTQDYQQILQRCTNMVSSYMNSIHVLINQPDVTPFGKAKEDKKEVVPSKVTPLPQVEEDCLFEEIDDIYHYVREGGKPPAPRPRVQSQRSSTIEISKTPPQTTDENYWEEPIYERIDKFQKIKKEGVLITTGATVSAAIDESYNVEPTAELLGHVGGEAASDIELVVDDDAPPVPPKRFDDADDDSASGEFEEIDEDEHSGSSKRISPEVPEVKDMSRSGSSVSPRRSPDGQEDLPREASSASLNLLTSTSPAASLERNSQTRRHSTQVGASSPSASMERDSQVRRHSVQTGTKSNSSSMEKDPKLRHESINQGSKSPSSTMEKDQPAWPRNVEHGTRSPTEASDNNRRVIFRSPTQIVETSARVNLRSPLEPTGKGKVSTRSPEEYNGHSRRYLRENSAPDLTQFKRHSNLDATHIVFNRDLKNQATARNYKVADQRGNRGPVTVSTNGHSASASVRSTPKYVAIARVGDPGPTKRSTYNHSNGNDENARKLDKKPYMVTVDSRRKEQSVYL